MLRKQLRKARWRRLLEWLLRSFSQVPDVVRWSSHADTPARQFSATAELPDVTNNMQIFEYNTILLAGAMTHRGPPFTAAALIQPGALFLASK